MFIWPWRFFRGASEKPQLVSRVVSGPQSLAGLQQNVATSGGGLWTFDITGIDLRTPDQIRCARAWAAYLDSGAQKIIVPFFDLGQAPRPFSGSGVALPGSPAPSDDYFSQEPGFGAPLIMAHTTAGAALRATTLVMQIDVGVPLRGGQPFSINHETVGWRTYLGRVTGSVDGGDGANPVQTLEIRPPLREAIAENTALEFDVPRTVMMQRADRAGDLWPDLAGNRFATVSAGFVEAF